MRIARIVSGGQTGADRAALDAAMHAGIPYGGGARPVAWPRTTRRHRACWPTIPPCAKPRAATPRSGRD